MGILKKAIEYEKLTEHLASLRPGEEQTIIIDDRAYVVSPAEVDDIERVPVGRVFIGD